MNIKKWTLVFCLAVPALAALGAGQVVEEIVAVVNDDVITLSEVKAQHDIFYQQLRAQLQGEEFEKQYGLFKSRLIDSMITDLLLLQQARERQFNVMDQVKMNIEALKKENNIESDDGLRRALESQGMTLEAFTKQMEEQILKQAVISVEIESKIVVDDAEVANYYKLNLAQFTEPEEYKLKAVYLSFEGRDEEAIEALKKQIDDKLKAGGDFAAVAAELADAPMKEAKGDLGTFKKGELDKSLEDPVSPLKKGETSTWIKAKNGWYLLLMEERKESRLKAFEEVKKVVVQKLSDERRSVKLAEYLKNLKAKSYIKILKPNPFDGN